MADEIRGLKRKSSFQLTFNHETGNVYLQEITCVEDRRRGEMNTSRTYRGGFETPAEAIQRMKDIMRVDRRNYRSAKAVRESKKDD